MGARTRNIEDIAVWCGIIWFVFIIDACFTWFFSDNLRNFIGVLFVYYATFLLYRKHKLAVSRHRRYLIVFIVALLFFMLFFHGNYLIGPLKLFPLICVVLWSEDVLIRMYHLFRKFIIFYAILSIGIEVLVLSGVWNLLPYVVMPPQDTVQENLNIVNNFYGLFCIPVSDLGVTFYRASGPLREGGHFAVFLGFVYYVEAIVYSKRNIWLIISGMLTLSPNFVLFFLVTEGYLAFLNRKLLKGIVGLIAFFIAIVFVFYLSPQSIKDEIVRIVVERTLENSINNVKYDGFMALLDGRSDTVGLQLYDQFVKNASSFERLFGFNYTKLYEGFVLSDIRYLLVHYGYIGLTLFLICTYCFSLGSNKILYGLALFLLAFGVMLQRAWMFDQVYIWAMMFLATTACRNKRFLVLNG